MRQVSIPKLIMKRLADDWKLLLIVFFGFTIVCTLAAATPLYLQSLIQVAFRVSVDGLSGQFLNVHVFASHVPLTRNDLRGAEASLLGAIDVNLSQVYAGHQVYFKATTNLVDLPSRPIPAERGTGEIVARGSFQHMSDLGEHVTFLSGRMAGDELVPGPEGPVLEAVISTATEFEFGLSVGDIVTLTPDLGSPSTLSAQIVGVIEQADTPDVYWEIAYIFLDQSPLGLPPTGEAPPPGIRVDPEEPPVVLFVTWEAMTEVVAGTYPGAMVNPIWSIQVEKESLKDWTLSEADQRLEGFETDARSAFAEASVSTAVIRGLVDDVTRRSFFSAVPLLLLLAVMMATVLFYVSMAVSFLIQSRARDAALLRSRGVGTVQMLRLYAMEGLVMVTAAALLAVPLAVGLASQAGRLSYFRDVTGGGALPVHLGSTMFLAVLGAALVCLILFAVQAVGGSRRGLLVEKLRVSRPPTVPLFHRYYADVAVLLLGGMAYWELRTRGKFITGGLFKDVEVNETLLLAPILVLVVTALVFIRLFPLLVRFINGESPGLLHMTIAGAVLVLAPAIAVTDFRNGGDMESVGPVALVLAIGAAYWLTHRAKARLLRAALFAVQTALIAVFVITGLPEPADALFMPALVLIGIIPGQVAFVLLAAMSRSAPVWVSIGLLHMSRNPLQYAWPVLLLVLATGLGILATTVGGTLERSQQDRVEYDLPTDIRIGGIPTFVVGGVRGVMDSYLELPTISAAAVALRTSGSVGPFSIEVLALESDRVPDLSWYFRDDFSDRPLDDVMGVLQFEPRGDRVVLPEGATSIRAWARPERRDPNLSLWMVIEDGSGSMTTLTLGRLNRSEWRLYEAEIPAGLEPPLTLVSVQIFAVGSNMVSKAGSLALDDIHVTVGPGDSEYVLEDFEQQLNRWQPIFTSVLSSDHLSISTLVAHGGQRAGIFTYGTDTVMGLRGFYQSPGGGPLPVVVSSLFTGYAGYDIGDAFVVNIRGRPVPVVVRDMVEYFPTMRTDGRGFMLVDLDQVMEYLNMLSHASASGLTKINPNELYLRKTDGSGLEIESVLDGMAGMIIQIEDAVTILDATRTDPLASAGWRAMVLVSLGVVLLSSVLGYVTYLILFASLSRAEMGFLRSMGLSRLQLAGLLGFEHLAVAAIGMGLGIWSGLQMSRLMVSALAVTEQGDEVVPPFVLVTDWGMIVPTFVVIATVFLAALALLNRRAARSQLNTLARGEDY